MAVCFDSKSFLPRTQSTSDIVGIPRRSHKQPYATVKTTELPRPASYTAIPILHTETHLASYHNRRASSSAFTAPVESEQPSQQDRSNASLFQSDDLLIQESLFIERVARRKSVVAGSKMWMRKLKGSPDRARVGGDTEHEMVSLDTLHVRNKPSRSLLRTPSIAGFAKKTWAASRSPSPNKAGSKDTDESSRDEDDLTPASSIASSSPSKTIAVLVQHEAPSAIPSVANASNVPLPFGNQSRLRRRQSDHGGLTMLKNASASMLNLSRRSSTETLSTHHAPSVLPPLPKDSREKLASLGVDVSKKKDELWATFRALEADFQKFQSKPSATRVNVLRTTLLPFLRNHAQQTGARVLRAEDVDRRTTILNKWWTALLDMLDGRNNQTVSGTDRPVVLEAVTGIMLRPEWRTRVASPIPAAGHHDRLAMSRTASSESGDSHAAQFLKESIYHNVHNLFVQNLMTQMIIVVEKMSLRNAPASLVAFCGKAVAYAFFFCPSVADLLMQLWRIPVGVLRRIAADLELPSGASNTPSNYTLPEFPSKLQSLRWTSARALSDHLRRSAALPLTATKVQWHGPWLNRWCGRDSDLFYVFCKHYHILLEDFIPRDTAFRDKAQSPGFVLVHAQLLTVMDATIHRHPSGDAAVGPHSTSLADVLTDADASVAALLPPAPPSNAARSMAENRIILLLRDFVSDRPSSSDAARHTFAEAFSITLRASARKTSQYDHNACFVLCDFVEEALAIYTRFQNAQPRHVDYIDWKFWLTACRGMLASQNSLTEIKLFSVLFGAWNMVCNDPRRKEVMCLEWLLSEVVLIQYFLHWCPMVRAYFTRLLCWRVCRYDGEPTELDTEILRVVSMRLQAIWANYLYTRELAEANGEALPTTSPCHPAPGRRFLIVRNDTQAAAADLMLGFDGIFPSTSRGTTARNESPKSTLDFSSEKPNAPMSPDSEAPKKKWSLLSKMIVKPKTVLTTPVTSLPPRPPTALARTKSAVASSRLRPAPPQHHSSSSIESQSSVPPTPTYRAYSFKFSLECAANNEAHDAKTGLLKAMRLTTPKIPAIAQVWLESQSPTITDDVMPVPPRGLALENSKYIGRALAEWSQLVTENNHFIDRRSSEGVPALKLMEVPTLGVDGFKRMG